MKPQHNRSKSLSETSPKSLSEARFESLSEANSLDDGFSASAATLYLRILASTSSFTQSPDLAPGATGSNSRTTAPNLAQIKQAANTQHCGTSQAPHTLQPAQYNSHAFWDSVSHLPPNEQLHTALEWLDFNGYPLETLFNTRYTELLCTVNPSDLMLPKDPTEQTSSNFPAFASVSGSTSTPNLIVQMRISESPEKILEAPNSEILKTSIQKWLANVEENPLDPSLETPPPCHAFLPQKALIGPTVQIPPSGQEDSVLGFDSETLAEELTSRSNTAMTQGMMTLNTLAEFQDTDITGAFYGAMIEPVPQSYETFDLDGILKLEQICRLMGQDYDEGERDEEMQKTKEELGIKREEEGEEDLEQQPSKRRRWTKSEA